MHGVTMKQNFQLIFNAKYPDVSLMTIKTYKLQSKHNRFIIIYYFNATCFDYNLRIIIRPSNEPTQDYLIPSALWDPVALTTGGVIVL